MNSMYRNFVSSMKYLSSIVHFQPSLAVQSYDIDILCRTSLSLTQSSSHSENVILKLHFCAENTDKTLFYYIYSKQSVVRVSFCMCVNCAIKSMGFYYIEII